MNQKIKISIEDELCSCLELAEGAYILGRSRTADIHLKERDISGQHLELTVRDEKVIINNLSSHGSRLNGKLIDQATEFRPGDEIALGKKIRITLVTGDDINADTKLINKTIPNNVTENTVNSIPLPQTGETRAAPEKHFDPEKTDIGFLKKTKETVGLTGQVVDGKLKVPTLPKDNPEPDMYVTDIMKTRLASVEEIEVLRRHERQRSTGKNLWYIFIGILALTGVILIYWIKPNAPEEYLSWPVDAKGVTLDEIIEPPWGGHDKDKFSIVFPKWSGFTREASPGKITITTKTGRDQDVPLRIILTTKRSVEFLKEDRLTTFTKWIKETSASGSLWNFDRISDVFFIGRDNGLPCLCVAYRREVGEESWYGEALFFRNADEIFIRQAEIPVGERVRGDKFIANNAFLYISPRFVANHWEGGGEFLQSDSRSMLDEAKRQLTQSSPFVWSRTALLLRSILRTATANQDETLKASALAQLRLLRRQQQDWFNSQRINYSNAVRINDLNAQMQIRDLCESVFSTSDDLRYMNVRRNRWE